jgi:hypothetical protein
MSTQAFSCIFLSKENQIIEDFSAFFENYNLTLNCLIPNSIAELKSLIASEEIDFAATYIHTKNFTDNTSISNFFNLKSLFFPPLIAYVDTPPSTLLLEKLRKRGVLDVIEKDTNPESSQIEELVNRKNWFKELPLDIPFLEAVKEGTSEENEVMLLTANTWGEVGRIYLNTKKTFHIETENKITEEALAEIISTKNKRITILRKFIHPLVPNMDEVFQSTFVKATSLLDQLKSW